MSKFYLDIMLQIIGIGSASGLFYKDHSLFIVSDNSAYLYEYNISDETLNKTLLIENTSHTTLENIPKNIKYDFEAITHYKDTLYIFGSGSTAKRNTMIQLDSKTNTVLATTDLSYLYEAMQSFGEIKPEDFNIEGAIYTGETWFLFNRGNGKSGKNAIFTIQGANLKDDFTILFNEYKLPKIKGVSTGFTDAIKVDDKIYFLAAAENSNSTYKDGKIMGSIIGRIDIEKMKIDYTKKLSNTHKFEGLTVHKKENGTIDFLLCEDADNEELKSTIYKLTIKE